MKNTFDKLVIVGVGLIGGSAALALRKAGNAGHIVGVGRSRASLNRAVRLGVIDEASADLKHALAGADVVLLAAPVGQNAALMRAMAPYLEAGTVVTDCGSTKQDVIAHARRYLSAHLANFVPGHPIAGSEQTGVDAARADLFAGKTVVLTPLPQTSKKALSRAGALWRVCGARLRRMDPETHDRVLAAVSHLPHVLAFALVNNIALRRDARLLFSFAAGGFRDFTRIAGSSPEMWKDVCIANRKVLLAELDGYQRSLKEIRAAVRNSDAAALQKLFDNARRARATWLAGKY
ncbi:MAG: prephenate dehydrogenase [Burkholderiales bacterium]